jgi:hypothetical protein
MGSTLDHSHLKIKIAMVGRCGEVPGRGAHELDGWVGRHLPDVIGSSQKTAGNFHAVLYMSNPLADLYLFVFLDVVVVDTVVKARYFQLSLPTQM